MAIGSSSGIRFWSSGSDKSKVDPHFRRFRGIAAIHCRVGRANLGIVRPTERAWAGVVGLSAINRGSTHPANRFLGRIKPYP